MPDIINSITKFRPPEKMLRAMTKQAVSHDFTSFSYKELAGGFCNAVYLIETDSEKLVLKVASSQEVVLMRHERDYVPAEAKTLELFNQKLNIPVPKLIYFDDSKRICSVPYFFMSFMEGTPLSNADPSPSKAEWNEIKLRVGEICREISSLKAKKFGIPVIPETHRHSNYAFVTALFKMLFMDIADKGAYVPETPEKELMSLLKRCEPALNEVTQPVYIHTDTWEGNLMVKDGKLAGIVDHAAVLWGDPLMNHDFHDLLPRPNPYFCKGFGKETFTPNEEIRMIVYRVWHRLGIIAERAFRSYDDPDTYAWALDEYVKEVTRLKSMIN